ncbi:polysaccharide pyruvyl transferase family protein [Butyrivibrio fibrisolvens]|uniref:Polysaccharide pyruvyl transferase domain-containing protein n=1 Tax=Butyrivibrio fibrisolvens TaxID=831 RepID=A0A317G5H7_BUTFI|nr:polysaccharide pyruvyl transferase family protein [Butyrivibrio fibrisolvens]PWT29268.1 hypothetical protein CPT75_20270 [Butyrivibrio fibrisolvens]
MTITIIGWYGTETLGDCAILDGILNVISAFFPKTLVKLGSLYPYLTERTVYEEKQVFHDSAPNVSIEIFNEKDREDLESSIDGSDLLVMGGGPLCDIDEVYIIKHAFDYARIKGISRIIMGCGLGPIEREEYISVVREILMNSNKTSFRDDYSIQLAHSLYENDIDFNNISVIGDPALISVERYKRERTELLPSDKDYVAVNFWNPPTHLYHYKTQKFDNFKELLSAFSEHYKQVLLIPMSTFFIGNDDRYLYTRYAQLLSCEKIKIIHKPINLYELYRVYAEALACFGVRYHAIVMQTVLNGNNYIYDYTDPEHGKIAGFIAKLNTSFYQNRYYSIYNQSNFDAYEVVRELKTNNKFLYRTNNELEHYKKWLSEIV